MRSKPLKSVASDFEQFLEHGNYVICLRYLADDEETVLLEGSKDSLTDLFEEFIAESREGDCFKLSMESPVEEIPLTSEELEK